MYVLDSNKNHISYSQTDTPECSTKHVLHMRLQVRRPSPGSASLQRAHNRRVRAVPTVQDSPIERQSRAVPTRDVLGTAVLAVSSTIPILLVPSTAPILAIPAVTARDNEDDVGLVGAAALALPPALALSSALAISVAAVVVVSPIGSRDGEGRRGGCGDESALKKLVD